MKRAITILILLITAFSTMYAQHAGTSIQFDFGNNINVPDNTSGALDITPGITIETWVKADEVTSDQKLYNKIGADFLNGYILGIQNGQIKFEVFDTNGTKDELVGGSLNNNGAWFHLAVTYATGGNMRIYINGELAAEQPTTLNDFSYTTNPLLIGTASWDIGVLVFSGQMDEIRFWQEELDGQTIRDWMLRYVNDQHPNFGANRLYFKCDEGTGTIANDSSPSGNSGTLLGTGWPASTAPFAGDSFDPDFNMDYDGVWTEHLTGSSGVLTLNGLTGDDASSIVMASDEDGGSNVSSIPTGYTSIYGAAYQLTVQGTPTVEMTFDLTGVDVSMFNSIVLINSADKTDYSNSGAQEGQLSGNTLTISPVSIEDGHFYTLAFGNITAIESKPDTDIEIKVFPNPFTNYISIESNRMDISVDIIDAYGRRLFSKKINQNELAKIQLANYSNGIYYLVFQDESGIIIHKELISKI